MKLVYVLALMIGSLAPASANDIGTAVLKCVNYLPMDIGIGATSTSKVTLSPHGYATAVEIQSYAPETEQGRRLATAAARAIMGCGPFPGAGTEVEVVIDIDRAAELPGPITFAN